MNDQAGKPASIEGLVSSVLGIGREAVTDGLKFSGIPEWDSLGHVQLMLALESAYGVEIDEDLMIELTSVGAIRRFVVEHGQTTG